MRPLTSPPEAYVGELVRHATPMPLCRCGHAAAEHRHDLKRASCDAGALGSNGFDRCACRELEPAALLWRESRVVVELL